MKVTASILIVFVVLFVGFKSDVIQAKKNQKIVQLTVGQKKFYVEIADTYKKRQTGLMFRDKLEKDHGMLFVFPDENYRYFWMKNTKIPLSIAFIKSDGWIAQIESMKPFDLTLKSSETRVKYVLEMSAGWFRRNAIKVGDKIKLPSSLLRP